MGDRRTLRHRGHDLVVTAEVVAAGTAFTLLLDGREVATHRHTWRDPNWRFDDLDAGLDLAMLGLDGARIQVSAWRKGRIAAAHLVLGSRAAAAAGSAFGFRPERIPFEPMPGTPAHRRWAWAEAHPRAHAARHVVVAVAQVAAALLGLRLAVGLLLGWLPDIDLPRIPRPDLPSIPWPDVSFDVWPDWTLPGWLQVVLDARPYWIPVLVAIGVATREHRRRQERRAEEAAAAPERDVVEHVVAAEADPAGKADPSVAAHDSPVGTPTTARPVDAGPIRR